MLELEPGRVALRRGALARPGELLGGDLPGRAHLNQPVDLQLCGRVPAASFLEPDLQDLGAAVRQDPEHAVEQVDVFDARGAALQEPLEGGLELAQSDVDGAGGATEVPIELPAPAARSVSRELPAAGAVSDSTKRELGAVGAEISHRPPAVELALHSQEQRLVDDRRGVALGLDGPPVDDDLPGIERMPQHAVERLPRDGIAGESPKTLLVRGAARFLDGAAGRDALERPAD